MAILMRRGAFGDFIPSKMLSGEWGIVLSDDPKVGDGKSVFICFSPGDVKRMSTYEDMIEQFASIQDELSAEFTGDINKAIESAEFATQNANDVSKELLKMKDYGEFDGPKGDSGVMVPTNGMFTLWVDNDTGNLYADYTDGAEPPNFEYDDETGNLYYKIERSDGTMSTIFIGNVRNQLINNLTTEDAGKGALDAAQGAVIKQELDDIKEILKNAIITEGGDEV